MSNLNVRYGEGQGDLTVIQVEPRNSHTAASQHEAVFCDRTLYLLHSEGYISGGQLSERHFLAELDDALLTSTPCASA